MCLKHGGDGHLVIPPPHHLKEEELSVTPLHPF